MTRYFAFADDKSDKFWQITTQDSSFTVTFGRTGTAGQSQTKTFDTADRCQQEVAKLIREKTNKGYAESVNGVVVAASSQPAKQPTHTDDQQAVDAILNRYDEIIRNTLTDELLPFLQSVDKRYYEVLRKAIKQAHRHWCTYVDLNAGVDGRQTRSRWDYRGTWEQRIVVTLSGLAFLNQQELKSFDYLYNVIVITDSDNDSVGWKTLNWAKPQWLTDYLLQQSGQGSWRTISYAYLRKLETAGLVNYRPELFARSVAMFQTYSYNNTGERTDQTYEQHIDFLATDEIVLSREIATVFDYAVDIHQCVYSLKNPKTKQYDQFQLWPQVSTRLLAEGKLDRLWFLERCLSVQTKDWKADLRSFWRKQFEAANPSPAELLALQTDLFPLLAAQHPHVVNWAVGLLKTIYTEPGFRVSEMLDWASSVMMRDDCKTALKTLLSLFERLLKTQHNHHAAITGQLADVFVVNELSLQTKAAQLLTKYADPNDVDLQSRLQTYTGQMLGNVANDLKAFLTGAPNGQGLQEHTGLASPSVYQYTPKLVPKLVPGQEVRLPETWNDFVFLVGRFIGSDDPLDGEILMNALILQPADKPDDWREQLKAYEKKLEKTYFQSETKRSLNDYLGHWLSGGKSEFVVQNPTVLQTMQLQYDRLRHLTQKRKAKSALPLLSLPTHAPHWIAPNVLIQRLLVYQRAGEAVEPLDLAIAIARTLREDTAEAVALCAGLDENIARLMRYCLGATTQIDLPGNTTFGKLLSALRSDDTLIGQQALWAVAARTHEPDSEFSVFASTSFAGLPNVQTPFVKEIERKETWSDWHNPDTNRQERSPLWRELALSFPTVSSPSRTLLYSNDLSGKGRNAWYYQNMHAMNVSAWYSLIPQQPEALFTVIAKYDCFDAGGSAVTAHAVALMLQPGFQFREMSLMVLSCGLLAKRRETGALAAEILIPHFSEQTLDATRLGDRLGWLLSGNYAPIQRLTDALNLVRDVSLLHNKALLLLLNALFAQLALVTELPKNTKKLLELYLDLLVKVGESPAAATSVTLANWQQNASLKKTCTEILNRY